MRSTFRSPPIIFMILFKTATLCCIAFLARIFRLASVGNPFRSNSAFVLHPFSTEKLFLKIFKTFLARGALYAVAIASVFLLAVKPLYAQSTDSGNKELVQAANNISLNAGDAEEEKSRELKQSLYSELLKYQEKTLVKDFTFFLGVSTGVSAFPISSLKSELDGLSTQLTEDLNSSLNDENLLYNPYLKQFVPPFSLSLDFRFFYKNLGMGISYDYVNHVVSDYRIGLDDSSVSDANVKYPSPVRLSYLMSGHGVAIQALIRKQIYVPQVQLIFGLGYGFNIASLKTELDGGDAFLSRSANYKSVGHGVRGLAELMIVYRYFTYGFGVMIESSSFSSFSNSDGTLTTLNGKKTSVGMLNSPLFYIRIGTRF